MKRRLEIREIRNYRLTQLIRDAGGRDKLAELAGTQAAYLQQCLDGVIGKNSKSPRGIGSRVARKLESAMGRPFGWMDSLGDTEQLAAEIEQLPPESRAAVQLYVQAMRDMALATQYAAANPVKSHGRSKTAA